MNNGKDIIIARNSQGELMMENLPNDLWNEIHDKYFKDKINQLVKQKTRNIESPYFFFTWDHELAYEVLNIDVHIVYQTDSKGLFYLLNEITNFPGRYLDQCDGSFIPIEVGTDFKRLLAKSRENAVWDSPELFKIPQDEAKTELTKKVEDFINGGPKK